MAISNLEGAIYNEKGIDIPDVIAFMKNKSEDWIKEYKNADRIYKNELIGLPIKVLCPCATDSTINSENAHLIKAQIVCAGANNPVTLKADKLLFENRKLYFPDFVTNCGGVLGNAIEFAGLSEDHLIKLLREEVIFKLKEIYAISQKEKIPTRLIAIKKMEEKLKKAQIKASKQTSGNLLQSLGLKLFRKGIVPKFLIRGYAYSSLKKRLQW
jgi:glutamate dehydrogenase/leucine dehydrogenase